MRHTSPHQLEFSRVGADKTERKDKNTGELKADEKPVNEFVNNGSLSQAQLQRLFYRRQNLLSKGQYQMNAAALMALTGDGSSLYDKLDTYDRGLIEDFLSDRVIGQRNYGDTDTPTNHAENTYNTPATKPALNIEDFDTDAQDLLGAIKDAEGKTGISQSYLVDLAFKESSFGTNMVAQTSSARGAYQFIEETWLRTVKQHGAEIGLGNYADLIDTSDKYASVENDEFKQKILDLRFNHDVSAHMAARFSLDNQASLERAFPDRDISNTDLYMAHFLGAGAAVKFIKQVEDNPNDVAASKFSSAANSNKWVFYSSTGRALSFDDVYDRFDRDFQGNRPVNVAALDDRDHLKSVV
jgi:hypothetical protein